MNKIIIFLISFFTTVSTAKAQVSFEGFEHLFSRPLQYNIFRVKDPIVIDGKLNEASWKAALWSADFTDIEGDRKPAPAYRTRFKMLWDESRLYIAAELEESAVWATLTQRDTIVFLDNDFEVFIDPDGDTHNYFEIEVNALKNVFDLFLTRPYRNGGIPLINWNVENLRLGVNIEGTINKPNDKDRKWTIELAIPFRSVSIGNTVQVPNDKTTWRINFSRVEWETEVRNNVYKKKKDSATGRTLPEHNWVWSPQGIIDMHYPERWGYVQFLKQKPVAKATSIQPAANENLKKLLWLIYYIQRKYYGMNKRFAASLDSLNFPADRFESDGHSYTAKLEATTNLFEATIKDNTINETWKINQAGEIMKGTPNP